MSKPGTSLGEALDLAYRKLNGADLFFGHGTDNAWDEAVELVLGIAGLPADSDDSVTAQVLTTHQIAALEAGLRRRIEGGEPLPYITGRAHFGGFEFIADARALVPRSPLGSLIRDDYAPWWHGPAPPRVLDLCCGGGCIGLTAALCRPGASVVLADIDEQALALAAENAALHDVGQRVEIVHSDLFSTLPRDDFDLILCNPPYVDAADISAMPREYRAEPLHALAAGEDGLDLAFSILSQAPLYLRDGGALFLELGNSWEALDALCPKLALNWLEFADGGHGVLFASREELLAWQEHFDALAASRRCASV